MTCAADSTLEFNLADYVEDPDNQALQLKWSFMKPLHSKATLKKDGRVRIKPKNKEWTGEDKVIFTVTDPSQASDKGTLKIQITAPAGQ
jgi:hypothetical protein